MSTDVLTAAGLNLHAVFDLAALPESLRAPLAGHDPRCRQLILIGHGGPRLWQAVQESGKNSGKESGIVSENPIDDFTRRTVGQWAAEQLAGRAWEIVYPEASDTPRPMPKTLDLQALGKLAGWHHDSPIMLGVNARWGSWFAYRAVLLAESDFAPTAKDLAPSPCVSCRDRPCIAACPARAIGAGRFDLAACLSYRQSPASRCAETCVARLACPVAPGERYPEAQIAHSYGASLRLMRRAG
jgi:hypothetical protein